MTPLEELIKKAKDCAEVIGDDGKNALFVMTLNDDGKDEGIDFQVVFFGNPALAHLGFINASSEGQGEIAEIIRSAVTISIVKQAAEQARDIELQTIKPKTRA